eukprot:c9043_g1_i1.p1 GENE.c9043_g1_i1~~c9043_g1_i1.p1  ORF type:complete len:246 (+),score=64.20 c9043_g1_i1:37-738(+)
MAASISRASFRIFTRNFALAPKCVSVGAIVSKMQILPGSWAKFADQADDIARGISKWDGLRDDAFYSIVNLGTKPGTDHTDVSSMVIFKDPTTASANMKNDEMRGQFRDLMVRPPTRLLCDGIVSPFNQKDGFVASFSLATVQASPEAKEDLFRFLSSGNFDLGNHLVWFAAFSQRNDDKVEILAAYKTFKCAREAAKSNSEVLKALAQFTQVPPPAEFQIHEWGQVFSKNLF